MRDEGDEGRLQRERDDLQQRDDEGDEGAEGDEETTTLRLREMRALRERGAFSLMKMWETGAERERQICKKCPLCSRDFSVWMKWVSCCRGCKSSSQLLLQARHVFYFTRGTPSEPLGSCLVPMSVGAAVPNTRFVFSLSAHLKP